MATAELTIDGGVLANNFIFVNGLRSALSKTETNVSAVEKSLRVIIANECWRHWKEPGGKEYRHNAAEFRRFIESPWPAGCGVSLVLVVRILRDSDLLDPLLELIRGTPGGAKNPLGANQHTEVIRDNVTNDLSRDDSPATLPLSAVSDQRQPRDYAHEAPTGNSVQYALRRLSKKAKESPEAASAYEQVRAGRKSPSGALRELGIVPRSVSIPVVPDRAAKLIFKHFQGPNLEPLLRELTRLAGLDVAEASWANLPQS